MEQLTEHERRLASMSTDFVMYHFKLDPCPNPNDHAAEQCLLAHPGDPHRRRHPSIYTPKFCPHMRSRKCCPYGDTCHMSHTLYEQRLHPDRYCVERCVHGSREQCPNPLCFFAHSDAELRPKPPGAPLPHHTNGRHRPQRAFFGEQGFQHNSSNGNSGQPYHQARPAAMLQQCVQVMGPHGAALVPIAGYQGPGMARGGSSGGRGHAVLHADPITGLVLPASGSSSSGGGGAPPQGPQTVVVLPNGQAQALVGVADGGGYMGGGEVHSQSMVPVMAVPGTNLAAPGVTQGSPILPPQQGQFLQTMAMAMPPPNANQLDGSGMLGAPLSADGMALPPATAVLSDVITSLGMLNIQGGLASPGSHGDKSGPLHLVQLPPPAVNSNGHGSSRPQQLVQQLLTGWTLQELQGLQALLAGALGGQAPAN